MKASVIREKRSFIKKVLFGLSLLWVSFIILDIPFGVEPILFADSPAYLAGTLKTGIVPIYPLFLKLNQLIWGKNIYLQIVIWEQILLASLSSIYFVIQVKKKFNNKTWECYLFLLLTFVPYTIFLSDGKGMACRLIATEALAFPLFYLFIIILMKGIWKEKIAYLIGAEIITVFLALTRTQLQLTLSIPVVVLFVAWTSGRFDKKGRRAITRFISAFFISIILFASAYGLFQQSNVLLQKTLSVVSMATIKKEEKSNLIRENSQTSNNVLQNGESFTSSNMVNNINSQYFGVLFPKVMLTTQRSDKQLFEDEVLKEAFEYVYNRMEEDKLVLDAMDKNMYLGDQIQKSITGCYDYTRAYLVEFLTLNPAYDVDIGTIISEFSNIIFRNHPFRWLVVNVLQLPSGFISTVFFHKRSIYWFCYLATFLIYGVAIGGIILGKKRKWLEESRREFLATSILINMLFVTITSIAYVASKRYVIYGFGVFYISIYLTISPLLKFGLSEIKIRFAKNEKQ